MRYALTALFIVSLAGCVGGPSPKVPANVNLSGQWLLNSKLSGDSQASEQKRMQAPEAVPFLPPPQFIITQTPDALQIEHDGSTTRYVYGEKAVVSFPGGVADRRTGWKGDRFVVDLKAPKGPGSTQSYELNKEGSQLTVTTAISGPGPGFTVKRVYDRVESLSRSRRIGALAIRITGG